jgi:hypothetical protein
MTKDVKRGILFPAMAVILMAVNLLNFIEETDCIRAIHVVSILVMGFGLGMLTMNLITLYKNRKVN